MPTAPVEKKIQQRKSKLKKKALTSTVLRFFPIPRTLRMPAAGIDISNGSVKFALLTYNGTSVVCDTLGKVIIPEGVIEHGLIQQPEELVKVLKKIQLEHHFEFVHVSLPEEHAYLFEISLPKEEGLEVGQALEFRLKENVPLSPEEVIVDYIQLNDASAPTLELSVSVYPIRIVSQYLQVLVEAGMHPLSFEIEAQATARALVPAHKDEEIMIVDIGASDAGISIVSKGILEYTATLDTAGDRLTKAIEKELGLSTKEAEEVMIVKGLVNTPDNKAFSAMLPIVESLCLEIKKHLSYWDEHRSDVRVSTHHIDRVLLCGGNAPIKGLAQYLTAILALPVETGNVWTNIMSLDKEIPLIHYTESLKYPTAIGLAIRSMYREQYQQNQ